MDKSIDILRNFFRASNIVFNAVHALNGVFGQRVSITPMHSLHRIALREIEKDAPDMKLMDSYLEAMESLAEENKNSQPTSNN